MTLAALSGKVVAVNFVYTRCALPQFCLRMSNNFAALQKRFARELGRDLVLLTITFDPERDTPEALASYASRWQANLSDGISSRVVLPISAVCAASSVRRRFQTRV